MLTITRTQAGWSDAVARRAVVQAVSRPPASGDLVTLRYPDGNWADTRIWDGSSWATGGQILNGNLLVPGTVAASALHLDGTSLTADANGALSVGAVSAGRITSGKFTSAAYVAGKTGFVIDAAGTAEFNQAVVRGTLDSSVIRASRLVSSAVTYLTEAGGRFATLSTARPVKPRWISTTPATNTINILDLQVADDDLSRFLGDAGAFILAASDTHGDNADKTDNTYLSRFHRHAPFMELNIRYLVPAGTTPWGAHIHSLSPRLMVKTKSGGVLADTGVISVRAHRLTSFGRDFTREVSVTRTGFTGDIDLLLSRQTVHQAGRHYTSAFTFTLRCAPSLNPQTAVNNQPLSLFLTVSLSTAGSFTPAPLASFANNLTLKMDTLS